VKIIKDDSEEMVLKESGILLYLIGGVVSLAGTLLFAQSIYKGEAVDAILVSIAFLGMGVLLILITENITVIVTHATRTIRVRRRRLLNWRTNEYQIDTVQSVALIANKMIRRSREMQIQSQLAIIVDNIPIPLDSLMYVTGRLERERAVGQRLASVLNVPFTDPTQGVPSGGL
jgi:uncharacterized membrane protein